MTFFVGTAPTGSTMFRVINRSGLYSIIMLFNQIIGVTVLSSLFLFYFKIGAAGVGYSFLASWASTFVITIIFVYKFDWKSLKILN